MALSDANRTRYRDMAQAMVPAGRVRTYVMGRSGGDPVVLGGAITVGFLVAAGAFYAATGGIFLIGLIPFLVLQFYVSPPRGLAVTDEGVTVIARGFWTSRPSRAIGTYRHDEVREGTTGPTRTCVTVGATAVWCTAVELGHLRDVLALAPAPASAAPAAPGTPAAPVAPVVTAPIPTREVVRTADLFPQGAFPDDGVVEPATLQAASLEAAPIPTRDVVLTKDLFPAGAYSEDVDLDELVRRAEAAEQQQG